jgi:hypothetical protein
MVRYTLSGTSRGRDSVLPIADHSIDPVYQYDVDGMFCELDLS